MKKTLKIAPNLDLDSFQKHMGQTDVLIYEAIVKSGEIAERDFVDRVFANNTKDLAEIQEMQAIVAKKQSQAITNCIMISLKNTKATQEVVQRMSQLELEILHEINDLNNNIKEKIECLKEKFNKQQLDVNEFKSSLEAMINDNKSKSDAIKTETRNYAEKMNSKIECLASDMKILNNQNLKLSKLALTLSIFFPCMILAIFAFWKFFL